MCVVSQCQWKNVELNRKNAEEFKSFLRRKEIEYEASEAFNLIHFECYVTDEEADECDAFLEELYG